MRAFVLIADMAKHEEQWWAARIEELAQGGDAKEIARRHGVREKTLIWWRSELRRRRRRTGPRLLPVVVSRANPVGMQSDVELVVEIGRVRMTMRGAVSGEHLAGIVAASARC